MKFTQRLILIAAAAACLLAAQDDPPGRIARMSYLYGTASFLPAGVSDWAPADYNRPLTSGDQVYVDFAGTVELETGAAVLRLGSATALEFLNLDDSNMQIRLTEGTLLIRVRSLGDQDSVEVDTPSLAFSLQRPGEYRIDVKPDSALTKVTVRAGEGELTGSNQAFTVHAGEQMQVTGADQPDYQTFSAPPPDTLDNFALQRDQKDDQSPSARYVSREMVGYQDLDKYGSWRDTPDYGSVWVPNGTPAGWAPYHDGHWVWQDPWGWTWVDDAPWGFAPAHYGRWAYVGNYWAWVPGPVAERPVYAPALVAWVGGGAVGGGVGWFPLGPREVYVPTYHTSPTYLNRVNVSNTVIVNNVNITNVNVSTVNYRNRTAPGAMMAVQRDAFAGARPVQGAAIAVRPEAAQSAQVVASVSIAPTRASIVRASAAGAARVAQPPAAVQSRAVIAKKTPPPPPVPFVQKQAALAANGGRPLDVKQVQQLRQSQPAPARPQVRQVQAQAPSAAPPPRGAAPQAPAAPTPPQRPGSVAPAAAPAAQQRLAPEGRREARPTPQAPPQPPAAAVPTPVPQQQRPAPEGRRESRPAPQAPPQPPAAAAPAPVPQQQRPAPEGRRESRPAPQASPQPAKEAAPAPAAKPSPPSAAQPAAKPADRPAHKDDRTGKKKEDKEKKDEK